ncbi:MAG: BstYI methyltransferase [Parcubacteria group bacterium GW2011_GWA2_44_12]|nr:MAG: BstYI methyltransferase [Parcubacteria group bacterium GW2011_GWA2_44_12]
MLTKRRKEVLDFVGSYSQKKGYSPSFEEIRKRLKLASVSTVHFHISKLKEGGYLEKTENKARAISVESKEPMVRIPLLGMIAAGEPIEAIQQNEFIAIPKTKLPPSSEVYALRVVGNSMIDENINDGDIILVKQQQTAENGQKVVALIDNHEATLKKYYRERGHIRLQPANKDMEPIILDKGTQVAIQGIVLDVIRTENPEIETKKKLLDVDIKKNATQTSLLRQKKIKIAYKPTKDAGVVLFQGDRLDLMRQLPNKSIKLVVTSPPYNIGKEYEKRRDLNSYLVDQEETIKEAIRILSDDGSICWQVGNHIGKDGEVFPLDALIYAIGKKYGLKLRNRIIWHFGHGLHCSKRFSGRHETIVWFTKSDNYTFNLDPIRVPQKYPGKKNFKKNEKYGTLSGNPLGKNPSDIWEIPNVKNNHPEKTDHPCQFPIELIERLVLSMTNPGDTVLDPYLGVGSAICAAVIHNRKGYGSDIMKEYLDIAEKRVEAAANGTLNRRMMGTPVYQPTESVKLAELPEEFKKARENLFGSRF